MSAPQRGLLDTSVFIAAETGRSLAADALPAESAISVVTLGELQAGVLAARTTASRARRLMTLGVLGDVEVLPVTEAAALHWAQIRVALADADRRLNVNDTWIAATALAHGLPVITQDADFELLPGLAGLQVLRV